MSARRLGSVISRSDAAMRPAPRVCRMFSSTARYSRASWWAAGVGSGSVMGSASTQRAFPVPGTPVPMTARWSPRMATAGRPPGRSPSSMTSATTPTRPKRPSMWGTSSSRPPAERADSTAARASSDSSAIVKTIPGSTTPEVRGSNGSVTFSFVIGFLLVGSYVMS